MLWILILVVVLMLVAALPTWSYSRGWGHYPATGLSVVLIVLLILILTRTIVF